MHTPMMNIVLQVCQSNCKEVKIHIIVFKGRKRSKGYALRTDLNIIQSKVTFEGEEKKEWKFASSNL